MQFERYMWVACVVLAACGPVGTSAGSPEVSGDALAMDWSVDPVDLAIERWEAVRGPVSARCVAYVRTIKVEWLDSASELNDVCNIGSKVIGCFSWEKSGTPVIYLRTDACNVVVAHEFVHALAACEQHDNCDADHTDDVLWTGLFGNSTGCAAETLYARPFDNPKVKAVK